MTPRRGVISSRGRRSSLAGGRQALVTAASSVAGVEAVVLMSEGAGRGSCEGGEVVHRGAVRPRLQPSQTGERLASTRAGQSRFHVVPTETMRDHSNRWMLRI